LLGDYPMEEESMLRRLRVGRRVGRRLSVVITACTVAAGSMLATAAPAQAATANHASVYADVWQNGYRGWVSGGVVMLCWRDGSWANGTNRWFAIYGGSISGFVNANLVSNQSSVPAC
jgi:hypothetical protein